MKDFHVSSNSTITHVTDLVGYNVWGIGYTTNFGTGNDFSNTHVFHSSPVNGSPNTATGHVDILDSIVQTMTVDDSHFTGCSFTNNTITFGTVTGVDIKIINCRSVVAGTGTPIFDFGTTASVDHYMTVANWQNGMEDRKSVV